VGRFDGGRGRRPARVRRRRLPPCGQLFGWTVRNNPGNDLRAAKIA
jgi:hypothetical protein